MSKPATTDYPLHPLLRERWSPRAFTEALLEPAQIGSLLEAARWAPSCFNEQPWRFFVAPRDQPALHETLAGLLSESNRAWAKDAAVLLLSVAKTTFTRNDRPNRHAWHDVGQATAMLVVQAEAMGFAVHQMAGFDRERAREVLGVPEGYEPATMIAIGQRAAAETLPEKLAQREQEPRQRRPLSETARAGAWDTPFTP